MRGKMSFLSSLGFWQIALTVCSALLAIAAGIVGFIKSNADAKADSAIAEAAQKQRVSIEEGVSEARTAAAAYAEEFFAATTGGDAFLCLTHITSEPPTRNRMPSWTIRKIGKYPMRNVTMAVTHTISRNGHPDKTDLKIFKFSTVSEAHTMLSGGWMLDDSPGAVNKINVLTTAMNGPTQQTMVLKKKDGLWISDGFIERLDPLITPAKGETVVKPSANERLTQWNWTHTMNSVEFPKGETKIKE